MVDKSPINATNEILAHNSFSDDGVLYIHPQPLFQIFTRSIDAIDVTSVTLSCLNSINAVDVKIC